MSHPDPGEAVVFNIGPQELLLILLVALVIVGPKRLPELSRTIGRGLREFRKAQDEVTKTIRMGLDETEPTTSGRARTKPAADVTAATTAAPGSADQKPADEASHPPPDDAAAVARSLGKGLAEIRRARREIQRTFRVDLSDRGSAGPRRPAAPAPPAPTAEGLAPAPEQTAATTDAPAPEPEPDAPSSGPETSE